MKSKDGLLDDVNIIRLLEYYIQCCSLESDTDAISIIAATLANGGINPFS